MNELTISNYGIKIEITDKKNILDILRSKGFEIPSYCGGRGTCGKCKIKFLNSPPQPTDAERKLLSPKEIKKGIRLACQHRVETDISIEISERLCFDTFIRLNEAIEDFSENLDVAIDLGTTTICMKLIDHESSDWILNAATLNPLIMFGSDVVSRMTWVIDKKKGQFFSKLLFDKISHLLEFSLSKLKQSDTFEINKMVIVGNNPMIHMLLNLDVSTLAFAPYESLHLKDFTEFNSRKFGFNKKFKILIPPSIGGFIGSDFLAVLYFLENELGSYGAVMDLGTNGEIGVWNESKIFVTSTAAGPAFEGMKIAHGMVAIDGAIQSFKIGSNNKFLVQTINGSKPSGICGSGLIDMLAEFLEKKFILKNGRINSKLNGETERILIFKDESEPIYLYQQDIRELQLSKAAISAAFELLIEKSKVSVDDINKIFLAGNFGNKLNIENSIKIGLLPKARISKFFLAGNAALEGAIKFCVNEERGRNFYREISKKIKRVKLESDENFVNVFVSKILF